MKKFFRFLLKLILGLIGFSIFMVLLYKWVPVPLTPLMVIRYFENPEEPIKHDWVAYNEISGYLPLAVLSSEDQNFFESFRFRYESHRKGY